MYIYTYIYTDRYKGHMCLVSYNLDREALRNVKNDQQSEGPRWLAPGDPEDVHEHEQVYWRCFSNQSDPRRSRLVGLPSGLRCGLAHPAWRAAP